MVFLEFLVALSIIALPTTASSHLDFHSRFNRHTFYPRNYITPDQRLSSYDYVIAGGGLAGLVLASKLSDDSSKTVLVLEAGPSGDEVSSKIDPPAETYFDSLLGAQPYDWLYKTAPQPNAGGRVMTQPRGRILGGSSAVNGMYMVCPSSVEVNTWHDLIASNDQAAAKSWTWDSFFDALKATETFTPPVANTLSVAGMKYNADSLGTSGNLHVTYPGYMVPVTGTWLPTLNAAGISISADSYGGNNIGGMFALSAINPANWTRSYSKSAYINPLPPRNNLHIISNATVEKIIFADNLISGELLASGLDFSSGIGATIQNVVVNKEVILSGGAMGSPHLLLVSGVGPKDILDAAGVPVKSELPGVGQHLQDHLAAGVFFETTVDTQGSIHASGSDFSKTPEFNSFVNSGVAYINGTLLFTSEQNFATFQSEITFSANSSASSLVPSQYSEVVEGYKAIYNATANNIYPTAGLIELLLSVNSPGKIAVQAALQQPLSQGRLYINSSSIWDNPVIDPQYFSHPADIVILRQGIKLARIVGSTSPLKESLGAEITPGVDIQTDTDIENWLRNNSGTEFHPGGTCAMLPKAQGGVVDANLKVYGLSNVRVVDSSVFPISFSAHLMAPTYALAEKAASIILAGSSTSSGTGSGSASGTSTVAPSSTTKASGASVSASMSWLGLFLPFLVGLFT